MAQSKIRTSCAAATATAAILYAVLAPTAADEHTGEKEPAPRPVRVRVGKVSRQTVQAKWEVVGRLRAVRHSVVAAELPGKIVQADVEEGQWVESNETILARIDETWANLDLAETRARVTQAKAQITAAEADARRAERDLQYLESLGLQGAARPKEVRDARDTKQATQALHNRAKAELVEAEAIQRRAEEKADRLVIRAPFDGVVVNKMVEIGQWVEEGSEVAEIISRGAIDAVIDVPERLINHVKANDAMEIVIVPLSKMVEGKVASITPLGSNAARTFPVKIRFDDRAGELKAGMSVLANVPTGEHEPALTVPRDAIQRRPPGTIVWAEIDGRAVPVPVNVLFGHADRYVVTPAAGNSPPLTVNTNVVIEGAERLQFPGQPLLIESPP